MYNGTESCPAENSADELARRVRPGLALELVINGSPVTFMNIHLKSGCANLKTAPGLQVHELTDPEPACRVLNRQIPYPGGLDQRIANQSPHFILYWEISIAE